MLAWSSIILLTLLRFSSHFQQTEGVDESLQEQLSSDASDALSSPQCLHCQFTFIQMHKKNWVHSCNWRPCEQAMVFNDTAFLKGHHMSHTDRTRRERPYCDIDFLCRAWQHNSLSTVYQLSTQFSYMKTKTKCEFCDQLQEWREHCLPTPQVPLRFDVIKSYNHYEYVAAGKRKGQLPHCVLIVLSSKFCDNCIFKVLSSKNNTRKETVLTIFHHRRKRAEITTSQNKKVHQQDAAILDISMPTTHGKHATTSTTLKPSAPVIHLARPDTPKLALTLTINKSFDLNETDYAEFMRKKQLQKEIELQAQWAYVCIVFIFALMLFAIWYMRGFHSRNASKREITVHDTHYLTVKDVLYRRARYLPLFNKSDQVEEVFVHDCGTNP